ncbi:MAG: TonB-dependent receptor [Bacteroidales bacterium]|nr:TonB-dependent receptor [Bacteroidales bacterium]MDD4713137.1 TonB-dependent receptor [Bacteroidales bacterium]
MRTVYKIAIWILFFEFCSSLFSNKINAQERREITGLVVDEISHNPVGFANVSIKKTSTGTTTDARGRFKINIAREKRAVIIVSHINYHKKEIVMNDSLFSGNMVISLSPKEIQLSDVVISAGLYEQPLEKLTRAAGVISHREILDNMHSNMTDMLYHTPGFTQVWEYHSPIILRGLNSNRLIIMKDGNRRIGTFPGGYFGQDLNIYDSRRVEILKGPGSVIYGSGAISGIINLISEKPFGDHQNSVQLHSGYGSNNNELLELVNLCHKREKYGISFHGKYRKTDEMIYGDGEIAENSDVEDRDFSINTGFKFSDAHQMILNANFHYGDWGKPRGFNGPTKRFTQVRNEEENLHADIAYSYHSKGFVESVHVNLYYDNGWRDYYQYKYSTVSDALSTLDLVHYKNQYGGGRFYTVLNLSETNKVTTGIDGYWFRLDNPSEIFDYYNDIHGEFTGSENAGQQNFGLFVNDEWKIGQEWQVVTGVRFDAATVVEGEGKASDGRDEYRNAFSGNAGLVYSLNEATHLSLNAGRAFRMPTAEELFTRVISCKGIKEGNPDLKPEYSWNFDFGLRGRAFRQKLQYDIALFYTILDDFINEAPAQEQDIDFTLNNTDAQLWGGELSAAYRMDHVLRPSNSLHLGAGVAYVYGADRSEGDDSPLFGIPPFKVNIELNYRGLLNQRWITGYFVKLDSEYAAAQSRIAPIPEGTEGGPWGYIPSDPHTVFNFSVGLNSNSLPGYPKLRLIAANIFDASYQPFGSYIPAMGRNIKLLLSFHF